MKSRKALAVSLCLVFTLTSLGGNWSVQEARAEDKTPETLKGIYEALIAPDSEYSKLKEQNLEYSPELEFTEELKEDRIIISLKANENEYMTDGSWEFVADGDQLVTELKSDDFLGSYFVLNIASAIGSYFEMETDLVNGYLLGLGALDIKSDNFSMKSDNAGTTTYSLNIAGPWDMKELDQMVLNKKVLDEGELGEESTSQGGSIGKIQYLANGDAESFSVMIAEYGELDDIAYQSLVNMIELRKPAGWEAFLDEFDSLKELETEAYIVDLDPDDEVIEEIMGERNDKRSYMLVRFGSDPESEE